MYASPRTRADRGAFRASALELGHRVHRVQGLDANDPERAEKRHDMQPDRRLVFGAHLLAHAALHIREPFLEVSLQRRRRSVVANWRRCLRTQPAKRLSGNAFGVADPARLSLRRRAGRARSSQPLAVLALQHIALAVARALGFLGGSSRNQHPTVRASFVLTY